jgi:biotin-dependent carboxylase-like uncharacterized protein
MIKVLKPGAYTSIQDNGRFGFRNMGVPVSGTMDTISASLANALLNNHKNDAVLECMLQGPKLEFSKPTKIVICGAKMSPTLNNTSLLNNKIYDIQKGDVLAFGKLMKGVIAYIAIAGGFQTPTILNSKSFYKGITSRNRLLKNDCISYKSVSVKISESNASIKDAEPFYETATIDVFEGPDLELFSIEEQQKLINSTHSISLNCNRMGYQLNETLVQHRKSIITGPVLPGTVQLIPSGRLIVLMKDAQTTGGYPRVFQLSKKAMAILAQKKAPDEFKFTMLKKC